MGQSAAGVGGIGAVLASVDREQSRGQGTTAAQTADVQTLPAVEAKIPEVERQRAFDERARERMLNPPRDQVSAGDAPDPFTLRTRTQGAVIENPHAMSAMDQLSFAAKRFKGSPSMRQAAAEMIMGGEQRKDANRQAELNANMTADATMAQGNAENQRLFADRKLKAQITNATLSEDARQADQNAQVDLVTGLFGGRRGAGGKPTDFAGSVYDDYLKAGYTPEQAAQLANRASTNAGLDPSDSDYGRWGQTQEEDAITRGRREYADRWFAGNSPDFDQSTATPRGQQWRERIASRLLPGGRDPDDIIWEDAQGRRNTTARGALPAGEDPDAYSLRRQRARELQGG